jgi:hypothetical protein
VSTGSLSADLPLYLVAREGGTLPNQNFTKCTPLHILKDDIDIDIDIDIDMLQQAESLHKGNVLSGSIKLALLTGE